MELKYMFIALCFSIATYAQTNQEAKQIIDRQLFEETFRKIFNDMDSHFENLTRQLNVSNNDKVKRYKAKVILAGMQDFANQTNIIIEEKKSRYFAEYGPYSSTEDYEAAKEELQLKVKGLIPSVWSEIKIKNGLGYQISDEALDKTIKVYHFYGDGNGIFVKVIFQVSER